jgi:hypothetical protein
MIHYNQEYRSRAKNYSSDKLDNVTSHMVTIGTRCPEWTYIVKNDDIKLCVVSFSIMTT